MRELDHANAMAGVVEVRGRLPRLTKKEGQLVVDVMTHNPLWSGGRGAGRFDEASVPEAITGVYFWFLDLRDRALACKWRK